MPESEPCTRDLTGTSFSPPDTACTLRSAFSDNGEGRGDQCAGNADAVADLKVMSGRIERDREVMMDHRALRRLGAMLRDRPIAQTRQRAKASMCW